MQCGEHVTLNKMSAFTPYKKAQKTDNGQNHGDLCLQQDIPNGFPINLTSMLFKFPSFHPNVFSGGYFDSGKIKDDVDKSEKFLIKNILKSEENREKQKIEKKRIEFEEQASKMEMIVSNLGKSDNGHRCIYCGKIYSRKYGLKIHIRTHTGYKPLKCKYCLRPFGDPSNLNKHVRLHVRGHTSYNCQFCGKILIRRRDLERHIKSKHAEPS